jgi:molecular chaperone GrpE
MTDSPAEVPPPSTADELQAALAERDDYKDKWARARADLENYRKRVQKELDDERKFGSVQLLKSLLPGFDGLQRAVKAAETSRNADELIAGVDLVCKQLDAALTAAGVQTIPAVGQPFDPNVHEAIAQQPSADAPPMTVLMEVERGYTLHDRVVRPTKVIVAATPVE